MNINFEEIIDQRNTDILYSMKKQKFESRLPKQCFQVSSLLKLFLLLDNSKMITKTMNFSNYHMNNNKLAMPWLKIYLYQ